MPVLLLLLAVFLWAPVARGGDAIMVRTTRQWELNQEVCFSKLRRLIACGTVVRAMPYRLTLSDSTFADRVKPGDRVALVNTANAPRAPATESREYIITRVPHAEMAITAGLYASGGLMAPMAHIQAALSDYWVVGLFPSYSKSARGDEEAQILGTFFTVERFPAGKALEGFFLHTALGAYSLRVKIGALSEGLWAPSAHLGVGYRFRLDSSVTVGATGGAQLILRPVGKLAEVRIPTATWLIKVDVGFSF